MHDGEQPQVSQLLWWPRSTVGCWPLWYPGQCPCHWTNEAGKHLQACSVYQAAAPALPWLDGAKPWRQCWRGCLLDHCVSWSAPPAPHRLWHDPPEHYFPPHRQNTGQNEGTQGDPTCSADWPSVPLYSCGGLEPWKALRGARLLPLGDRQSSVLPSPWLLWLRWVSGWGCADLSFLKDPSVYNLQDPPQSIASSTPALLL